MLNDVSSSGDAGGDVTLAGLEVMLTAGTSGGGEKPKLDKVGGLNPEVWSGAANKSHLICD